MAFIDELNKAQQEAVLYNEGPHLVIAGAGSGKTRVLTYKIAYLLSTGVEAQHIMALTFTNKAAREMKERISGLVGEKVARYLWMGTFHSMCAKILRQESRLLGYSQDFTIYDTQDSKSLLKQIVKDLGEDEKIYKVGDLLGKISDAKNGMMGPRDYAADKDLYNRDRLHRHYRMAEIYNTYQVRLKASNAMDFDDLLFNMNRLLEQQPEVREKYQDWFEYLLVDEYQDTNFSQYLIVKRLADKHKKICVVGDDAQSIYSFRGADIRNILMFQDEYKGSPVFKLERNYRSTQNIVNAANSLIHHNRHQIHKDVYSENGVGDKIEVSSYNSDRDEAHYIAEKMYLLHAAQSRSYEHMACLYRTNAQSRVVEDELRRLNIPYRIYGGTSFYQRKEIKDALAYFRITVNPLDNEALNRAAGLQKGLGETTMKKVRECAAGHGVSYFEVMQHPMECQLDASAATYKKLDIFAAKIEGFMQLAETEDAYTFAVKVMNESGVMIQDQTPEGLERLENLKELQSAVHEFVEQHQEGGQVVRITDFLSEVALLTDQDQNLTDDTQRVTLMTIHAAKGLEYDAVFIAGLEENLFPSMYCETESELEEERRLFYVAITRAKDLCFITSARSRFRNGQISVQSTSRFLKDIDSRYVTRIEEERVRRPQWSGGGFFDDDREPSYGRSGRFNQFDDREPMPTLPKRTAPRNLQATTGMQLKTEKQPIDCAFPVGSRIEHAVFGPGTVLAAYQENGNDKIEIEFDKSGKKTLLLKFAKLERI